MVACHRGVRWEKHGSMSGSAEPARSGCPATQADRDRYNACVRSDDESTCKKNSGAWGDKLVGGASGKLMIACACQIPDQGCPCKKSGECVGDCVLSPPADWADCPKDGQATCQPHAFGCHCWVDREGKVEGGCID